MLGSQTAHLNKTCLKIIILICGPPQLNSFTPWLLWSEQKNRRKHKNRTEMKIINTYTNKISFHSHLEHLMELTATPLPTPTISTTITPHWRKWTPYLCLVWHRIFSLFFHLYQFWGTLRDEEKDGSRFLRGPSLPAVLPCNCQSLTSAASCRLARVPHGGTWLGAQLGVQHRLSSPRFPQP